MFDWDNLVEWFLYEADRQHKAVYYLEQPEGVSREELELCFIEQYVMEGK